MKKLKYITIFISLMFCSCRKSIVSDLFYYKIETTSPKITVTYKDYIGNLKTERAFDGWLYGWYSTKKKQNYSIIVKNDTTFGKIKVNWYKNNTVMKSVTDSGSYVQIKI